MEHRADHRYIETFPVDSALGPRKSQRPMRCPMCRREYPAGTGLCKHDGSPLLEPVSAAIQRGPVSLTQTVKIIDRLCDLLSGMHIAGKVHGNISAGTVFFRHVGAVLNVAITELDEPRTVHDPRYQPPERSRGEAEDRRADIYAVGILLFHMLRGRPPVDGPGGWPPTLLDDTLQNIPDELDALVKEMLAKQVKDRPKTVDEVRARLENMDLDSTVMGVRLAAVKRVAKEVQAESMDSLDGPTMEAMDAVDSIPPDEGAATRVADPHELAERAVEAERAKYPDADDSAFADTHLRIDRKQLLIALQDQSPPELVPPPRTASLQKRQQTPPDAITEAAPPRERAPSRLPTPILIAGFVLVVALTAAAAILLFN